MGVLTYNKLINTTLHLYLRGKYISAYEYITGHAPRVEGNEAQVFNFRYAIASRAGMTDIAMDLLDEAVMRKKFWYSYDYLMSDDDLAMLREREEFGRIAEVCRERESDAKKKSAPDLKILGPVEDNGVSEPSLLLALHGNEENIRITEGYWNTAPFSGFMKAFPQSSDIGFSDAYFWNHPEKGGEELERHLERISEDSHIGPNRTVLGGFSAGARTALFFTLYHSYPVRGLILVCPWFPEIEKWSPRLDVLKDRGVRVCIVAGGRDHDCLEHAECCRDLLVEKDIPLMYRKIMQLEHDYPDNFDAIQKEALDFIFTPG